MPVRVECLCLGVPVRRVPVRERVGATGGGRERICSRLNKR